MGWFQDLKIEKSKSHEVPHFAYSVSDIGSFGVPSRGHLLVPTAQKIATFLVSVFVLVAVPAQLTGAVDCGGITGVWVSVNPPKRVIELGKTSVSTWYLHDPGGWWAGAYSFEKGMFVTRKANTNIIVRFPVTIEGGRFILIIPNGEKVAFERVAPFGRGYGEYIATGKRTRVDPYTEGLFRIYTSFNDAMQCGEAYANACKRGEVAGCRMFEVWLRDQDKRLRGLKNLTGMLGEEVERLEAQNRRREAALRAQTRDQIAASEEEASGHLNDAWSYVREGNMEAALASAHRAGNAWQHADDLAESLKR